MVAQLRDLVNPTGNNYKFSQPYAHVYNDEM